jgi:hypothetical protein
MSRAAGLPRTLRPALGALLLAFVPVVGCGEREQDQGGEGDFVCQAVCRRPDGTLEPGGTRRFEGVGKEEAEGRCEQNLTGGGIELCIAPNAFANDCNCTFQPEDDDAFPTLPAR